MRRTSTMFLKTYLLPAYVYTDRVGKSFLEREVLGTSELIMTNCTTTTSTSTW